MTSRCGPLEIPEALLLLVPKDNYYHSYYNRQKPAEYWELYANVRPLQGRLAYLALLDKDDPTSPSEWWATTSSDWWRACPEELTSKRPQGTALGPFTNAKDAVLAMLKHYEKK